MDDRAPVVTPNAPWECFNHMVGFPYTKTSRVQFRPIHDNYDASYNGFYIDDFAQSVETADGTVLASYATGFEEPPPAVTSTRHASALGIALGVSIPVGLFAMWMFSVLYKR